MKVMCATCNQTFDTDAKVAHCGRLRGARPGVIEVCNMVDVADPPFKLLTSDFVPKPEVNLTDLANEIYEWAVGKGFYDKIDDFDLDTAANLLESVSIDTAELEEVRKGKLHPMLVLEGAQMTSEQLRCAMALMLIVTEVVEIMEDVMSGDVEHESEEVADTMIRLLDYAGYRGYDIHGAVEQKMEINRGRPYRHGKKF